MLPIIRKIANEYKDQLQGLYKDELVELILFGSYARGDNWEESDIDFAIALGDLYANPTKEIFKIAPISSRLSLKYDMMLSSLPVSHHKKQTSMEGIYQEIRKEGIVI